MQKIIPSLWFDGNAEEAMNFYTSIFKNSKTGQVSYYGDEGPGKKGSPMVMTFRIEGLEFMAINGGPEFTFTPAISLFVNCTSGEEMDELFRNLSEDGNVLMEPGSYSFSEKFAWFNDKYGLSWQLNFAGTKAGFKQKIIPFFLFVGQEHGNAEEALRFYTSLFPDSAITAVEHFGPNDNEPEGTLKQGKFSLCGLEFIAMDSSLAHAFTFTPAFSFMVNCTDQAEVDFFWNKLSEGGNMGQCGWLEDRYGVAWQIVPEALGGMMNDKDPQKASRVRKALLKMNKLEIEKLKEAYAGSD
ncbi:MAG: VOC family protein [Ignavibacteria bacterium]|jgi:predicted 3-demethylubiquinone-9 3-methyltransferase (glyoxalase superfamily)|nr:VOC family protein [Ignavibacteria bacterium]MCU7504508.1 VOC family protein [Ignavibacteria bacterium]MCU7517829.1 VOC family protein [Ignavibacteria bacterium]